MASGRVKSIGSSGNVTKLHEAVSHGRHVTREERKDDHDKHGRVENQRLQVANVAPLHPGQARKSLQPKWPEAHLQVLDTPLAGARVDQVDVREKEFKNEIEYVAEDFPNINAAAFISKPRLTVEEYTEPISMEPTSLSAPRLSIEDRGLVSMEYDAFVSEPIIQDFDSNDKNCVLVSRFVTTPNIKASDSPDGSGSDHYNKHYTPKKKKHHLSFVEDNTKMSYTDMLLKMNDRELRDELFKLCQFNDSRYIIHIELLCKYLQAIDKKLHTLTGDEYKETALHIALIFDNRPAADLLVRYGGKDLICAEYDHDENRGTTALHLAVVKGQREMIQTMMLILAAYDQENSSSLLIEKALTVTSNSTHKLQYESAKQRLLHQQATGSFFEKRFDAIGLPLILAALSDNDNVFFDLLDHGADLYKCDVKTGNNIIHALVEYSLYNPKYAVEIYIRITTIGHHDVNAKYHINRWLATKLRKSVSDLRLSDHSNMRKKLVKQKNFLNLTPLMFACRLGAKAMFQAIMNTLQLYKHQIWEYGPVREDYYDITELDTNISKQTHLSGLELLVYTSGDDILPILDVEPVKTLIHTKWAAYRYWFLVWALLHVLLMVTFSVCAFLKKEVILLLPVNEALNCIGNCTLNNTSSLTGPLSSAVNSTLNSTLNGASNSTLNGALKTGYHTISSTYFSTFWQKIVMGGDVIVFFSALVIFGQEYYDIILGFIIWYRNSSLKYVRHKLQWYTIFKTNNFRLIYILFAHLALAWFVLQSFGHSEADLAAVPALILGWYWMLFFTRAFRNIGVFIEMISRLLVTYIFYFSIALVVILIGFLVALLCLIPLSGFPLEIDSSPVTLWRHMRQSADDALHHCSLIHILLFIFVILILVILLNTIIAAMGETYGEITKVKGQLWTKLLAESIFIMERRIPHCLRPKIRYRVKNGLKFLEVDVVKSRSSEHNFIWD